MSDQKKVFPEFQKMGDAAVAQGGMTLRQFYAAEAMKGFLSNPSFTAGWLEADPEICEKAIRETVKASWGMADAMIAFEEKEGRHE